MKKYLSILSCLSLCLTLFSTQCEEDIPIINQESEQQDLEALKTEIENLANTSICDDGFECQFIAFGSKPCGGPAGYLIYSTSVDTEKLENLVLNYNEQHAEFNTKWGIVSDCSIVNPPSSINCENNVCVAVY